MENSFAKIKDENLRRIRTYSGNPDGTVDFYPRYIQLEHTTKCNAECIMCNHFYIGNRGAIDLSEQIVNKIEPILPYCSTLILNGNGEPFLCKNIESYLLLYRKYEVQLSTNTNFCCIPESVWPLLESCFHLLQISCDGATKETFEYVRRNTKFETLCQNLERLNREAPHMRKHMNTVIMRQNVMEMPQLVEFAAKHKFERAKFHMLGVNPCIGNQRDSAHTFMSLAAEKAQQAVDRAAQLGIAIEIPYELRQYSSVDIQQAPFDNGIDSEIDEKQKELRIRYANSSHQYGYQWERATEDMLKHPTFCWKNSCSWALERCYIGLNGNVSTCCYNTRHHLGNLLENTFDEIWNGAEYRALRQGMLKGMLPKWCQTCNWLRE